MAEINDTTQTPDLEEVVLEDKSCGRRYRSSVVAEEDTVPLRVQWLPDERKFTDISWGSLYVVAYIAFIGCGTAISVHSQPRYVVDSETDIQYISDYYLGDVMSCCSSLPTTVENNNSSYTGLCNFLQPPTERRNLAETGDSKFNGDEGIFDAFVEAPEIIVGIISAVFAVAVVWVILLRFFARPIVIVAELAKIILFIILGIKSQNSGVLITCIVVSMGILAYDIWARKEIIFAADIISHSTVAFKENPSMFAGLGLIQIVFVLNAFLFVYFFSKAFGVTEVQQTVDCYGESNAECYGRCEFSYRGYVTGASIYMSLAYLWTIFLFEKFRLSVIAHVVGAWHFHPEERPTMAATMRNTLTSSFGTLSVAALISTIAEKLNRMAQQPWYRSILTPFCLCTAAPSLLLKLFSSCISTVVKMLTKFAVILHVWTGLPFVDSAKKAGLIMSRHFKGGFVTEMTSQGVLKMASYAFSLCVTLMTWAWFDERFQTDTLPGGENTGYSILFLLLALFELWYPVLGLYVVILVDKLLRSVENQHIWLPPVAGMFVGCLAMMIFTYISGIFLDTIDVLFLCFAVEVDHASIKDKELEKLVSSLNVYLGEVVMEEDKKKDDDPTLPVVVAQPVVDDL